LNRDMMIVYYYDQPFVCVFQVEDEKSFGHQFYLGDDVAVKDENINHKLDPAVLIDLIQQVDEGRS